MWALAEGTWISEYHHLFHKLGFSEPQSLHQCYDLNACVPPKFICCNLMSKMMVSGGRPLGGD